MKMVVRSEVDACLPTDADPATATKTGGTADKKAASSVDDLADALGGMNLPSSAPTTTTQHPAINIVRAGTQIPQEALLEVVSHSVNFVDQLDWNELYPQLVLSQTPALRLGVHDRGTFMELREWQIDGSGSGSSSDSGAPDLSTVRKETAVQIVRLARVLEDVQELAIARCPGPAGSFSLVCVDGELCAYGRSNNGTTLRCPEPASTGSSSIAYTLKYDTKYT